MTSNDQVRFLEEEDMVTCASLLAQGKKEEAFSLRLFQYHYRLFDRYGQKQSIATLAILTDDHSSWCPKQFQTQVYGSTAITFDFHVGKVLHYKDQKDILRKIQNLFGIVVLAHLTKMETKKDLKARLLSKLDLTDLLFSKGYSRDTVLEVLKFIDWVLVLPRKLALEYRSEVYKLEGEKRWGMQRVWNSLLVKKALNRRTKRRAKRRAPESTCYCS